jgi:hypothetical protein
MRHRRPFSVYRSFYVTVDEGTKVRSLLIRQVLTKENNGSECAGFCGDRKLGPIEIIPDLDGHETNEQAEYDSKWR